MPPLRGLRERYFRHSPEVQRRTDEFPLGLGLGQAAHAELSKPENAFYPGIRRFGEPFAFAIGALSFQRSEFFCHRGTQRPLGGIDLHVFLALASERYDQLGGVLTQLLERCFRPVARIGKDLLGIGAGIA